MTPEEIAERFDISISAAKIRAPELEKIRRIAQGIKRPLPPSIIEFLLEAKRKGHRVTSLDD
jgi:hypothetical protein